VSNNNVGQKLVENFAKRIAPHEGINEVRPDLFLADFEISSRDSAKLLIAWSSSLDNPTSKALDNYVLSNWNGYLKSDLKTIRLFPEERVATLFINRIVPMRRLEDSNAMLRLSPTRYMEASASKYVWEVRESSEGEKHLVQVQADNLEELLEERRKAIRGRKGGIPTFASVRSAGNLNVEEGDVVKFYYQGLLKEGRVGKVNSNLNDLIVLDSKRRYDVKLASIVDVVTKDPSTIQNQKERVKEYWKKILPPEYIEKWLGKEEE